MLLHAGLLLLMCLLFVAMTFNLFCTWRESIEVEKRAVMETIKSLLVESEPGPEELEPGYRDPAPCEVFEDVTQDGPCVGAVYSYGRNHWRVVLYATDPKALDHEAIHLQVELYATRAEAENRAQRVQQHELMIVDDDEDILNSEI